MNAAAVLVMGDAVLRTIAKELTDTIRKNVTIDWTERESARARLRTMVKRLLRKHGYPPDKQEQATATVMEQAERLCETWADEGVLEAVRYPEAETVEPGSLAAEGSRTASADDEMTQGAGKKSS